jgi:hypothetical protein
VTLDHIDPMCSLSLSSVHIGLHALVLYLGLILYECHTSLSILCDVEFGLCLCEKWSPVYRDVI